MGDNLEMVHIGRPQTNRGHSERLNKESKRFSAVNIRQHISLCSCLKGRHSATSMRDSQIPKALDWALEPPTITETVTYRKESAKVEIKTKEKEKNDKKIRSSLREFDACYKILIIGDSGVGKTTILRCLQGQEFSKKTFTTVGMDFVKKIIDVDGAKIKLEIWDTAGQERFRSMTRFQFRGTKGAILVYDVTDRESYNTLNYWLKMVDMEIDQYSKEPIPVILLGNKADKTEVRQVSYKKGLQLSEEHFMQGFRETSARTGKNVLEAVTALTQAVTEINNPKLNAKTCEGNQDSDYSDDSDGGVPNGKAATTDNNEENYVPYDRTEPYEGDEQTQDVGDEDDNENGDACASASHTHAAKKLRCLTPDTVKRQLLTSDDDEHNRRIIAAKQKALAAEIRGKGKGKNRKPAESTDRSEIFQKISDAITNYPPPATVQAPADPDASDPDMLWGKLLGYKIKQIQKDLREEFKMFVDMQALQAARGNWSVPSPTKMLPRPRPSPRTSPFKFVVPRATTAASHTGAGEGATASASGSGVGALPRTGTQQPAVTLTAEEFYEYCQQYGTADLEALGNMPTS